MSDFAGCFEWMVDRLTLSHFFSRFRWYRRMCGGRWEYHFITICKAYMWLQMHPKRKWPEYRQPCSFGIPLIEDYPEKKS